MAFLGKKQGLAFPFKYPPLGILENNLGAQK